ncbi:uncharacterized protein [Temnothorax nylanderi]|uniref:uncharacterized protein n=1 Tax=Temnothorax nylanderi TaxID=102681 RepID=UPI003A851712
MRRRPICGITAGNTLHSANLAPHHKSLGAIFINAALKEIMTDELVNKFTWSGGAESRNFGDTKIVNILYLAAQNCPFFKGPESKMEFKMDMQEVLRAAKQRIRNRIKKMQL